MSDFILVEISAEAKVRYKKRVNMTREDYEKYLALCEEYPRNLDEKIAHIAVKYGFDADMNDVEDIDDPEDIEFERVVEQRTTTEGKSDE